MRSSSAMRRLINSDEQYEYNLVQLREYQEDIWDNFIDSGDDLALSMSRRSGKDIMVMRKIDQYCSENAGTLVYYYFVTLEQAVDAIVNNSLADTREPYLGAVFDTRNLKKSRLGNWLHNGKELHYKNGSVIKLSGIGTASSTKMGTNADFVVYSEAGLMYKKFTEVYDLMSPSLSLTGGRQIAISTPRYGSDFNEIFNKSKIGWLKIQRPATMLFNDDGSRVFDDDMLSGFRLKTSEEKFKQEWLCDMEVANVTSIYGQSLTQATRTTTPQDNGITYVSFDLGINDSTAMVFSKLIGGKVVVIDSYESVNKPTQHYIDVLNDKPYGRYQLLLPHDGANRMDIGTRLVSRADLYRSAGFNVHVLKAVPQLSGIECTRASIQHGDIVFSDNSNVTAMIDKVKGYEWKTNKSTGECLWIPHHGTGASASNMADALEYICIYNFYNKYIDKTKDVVKAETWNTTTREVTGYETTR